MFPSFDDSGRRRGGERSDQGKNGVTDVVGRKKPCYGGMDEANVPMRFNRVGTVHGTGTFGKPFICPFYRGF